MTLKIAVDLHFSNLKDGLYTDMGSEGRWGTNWAKLLAENGQEVDCICADNVYGWGSGIPVPNVNFINKIDENKKYDIALLTGQEVPQGLKADLHMFMHFSPCTFTSSEHLYKPDNSIIVYPHEVQFKFHPINKFENKSYFMPTPLAEKMEVPNFNRKPSIAWTDRWGPGVSSDRFFNSFIKFVNMHNLHTIIFSYQNFYALVQENEREEGVRKITEQVNSIQSIERIKSVPSYQIVENLKNTKFAMCTHGGGVGGSILEQIICGTFPLPGTTTFQLFNSVDAKFYDNSNPETVDEILKNWEMSFQDESFYMSAIKAYQKEVEPYLYKNCLSRFSEVTSKYGFKL